MGKTCLIQRKPDKKSTRLRWLAAGIDIGLRVHEILQDYLGVQAGVLPRKFGVMDSGIYLTFSAGLKVQAANSGINSLSPSGVMLRARESASARSQPVCK